jgi:hypothetical protein
MKIVTAIILIVLALGVSTSSASRSQLSTVKSIQADDGMLLLEFSFIGGFPEKYKVAFADADGSNLTVLIKNVDYNNILLNEIFSGWVEITKITDTDGEPSVLVVFRLKERVPFRSEFKEGKLLVGFADVRYDNTFKTVLMWLTIPVVILISAILILTIE